MSGILNNRFVDGEPAEDYHKVAAISSHAMITMAKSPRAYHEKYVLKKEQEVTDAMILGTKVHCALLEPERFGSTYFVMPKVDRRTTAGKQELAEFLKGLPVGSQCIDATDYEMIKAMQESVLSHRVAADLLKEGKAEQSGYLTDIDTGLSLKIRPDFITVDNMLIDLKTTRDASKSSFQSSIKNFGYACQLSFYVDCFAIIAGIPKDETPFVFIAVENVFPYGVAVYTASKRLVQEGREIYKNAMFKYIDCVASGKWPDHNEGRATEIDLPNWHYSQKSYEKQ